jgi:hypothetical protein
MYWRLRIVPVRIGMMHATHPHAAQRSALMAIRTTQTVVSFASPFLLPGFEELQPAGDYRIDHDEESIDGASWLAWRRVGSFIHLPGIGVQRAAHQMIKVDPADIDAALEKDQKTS